MCKTIIAHLKGGAGLDAQVRKAVETLRPAQP